jgi:anthranilate synthase
MIELETYTTNGGIAIIRRREPVDPKVAIEGLIDALDVERGVLLSSGYDYPGRYTRWDLGLKNPPLALICRARSVSIEALNARGRLLLQPVREALAGSSAIAELSASVDRIDASLREPGRRFAEEERSKQPSVFSLIRSIVALFGSSDDHHLGLYGAFGYDLTFQFESIRQKHARPSDQRDLVLYLPDELIIVDHQKETASRIQYSFEWRGETTSNLPAIAFTSSRWDHGGGAVASTELAGSDHRPGEYADAVRRLKHAFKSGDLFEVVLSQTFKQPCSKRPSEIFRWLRQSNPAPYALLLNLGDHEHLVGASPEMYVRVEGQRVESCPISGTIGRGNDAVEDAERIRELLSSHKDESELTMCTDVDRNDKSRICEPGSVRVIGRRQIELYSRLIHTVDHVEGRLRPGFDALDAFLTHTWAVTVTGAPKPAAIQRVEDEERSPRAWYGGAIGVVGFDGNLNTGLTLRTVRLRRGLAEVRAGATLLYDSDPEAEERETQIKASAFLDAVRGQRSLPPVAHVASRPGEGQRVVLVDHEDSFVHTLANYLRQTGATVTTLRRDLALAQLDDLAPDLVVLSPGPGSPSEFELSTTIAESLKRKIPIFGVCLGLQGIGEYFGGKLGVLDYPMHGKPSRVNMHGGRFFKNLPKHFTAGRYHSLFVERSSLPAELSIVAETDDGVIMALEHRTLPVAAVQFHPESILTLHDETGLALLRSVMAEVRAEAQR